MLEVIPNDMELVPVPSGVVMLIGPLVAPAGTVSVICVSETTVNELPGVPLKFTAVAPVKPEPLMVTLTPNVPVVGVNEAIWGGTRTVNALELTPVPPEVVTLINPVDKPAGTTAVSCVSETTVNVAA